MMKSLVIAAFMIISLNVFSSDYEIPVYEAEIVTQGIEFSLATMTNDMNRDKYYMLLETNEANEVVKLHADKEVNGNIVERQTIEADKLEIGYVLMREQGKNVITIKSDNFSPHNGGHINVVYLNNAIGNKYNQITIEVVNDGDTWSLYDYNQRKIKNMHFKAKKVWGKIVGIDSIIFSY